MNSSILLANLDLSPVLVGVILCVIGFIFLFFGVRLFKPILFLTGVAVGGISSYILLLNLANRYPTLGGDNQNTIMLIVPFIIGLLLGFLFLFILKLGILSLGALGGFSLAVFILSWQSDNDLINSPVYRPIFISVMICIGSILTMLFERVLIIICTCLFGAGAICSGLDVFIATGFNQAINNIIYHKGSVTMNDQLVGILVSYVVIVALGMFIQFKFHRHIHYKNTSSSSKK